MPLIKIKYCIEVKCQNSTVFYTYKRREKLESFSLSIIFFRLKRKPLRIHPYADTVK